MPDFNGGPDNGTPESPCAGSEADYITTVIQTRMFTALGDMGIDCSNVETGRSPCDIWTVVMASHRPAGCVTDPPPPPDPYGEEGG